MSFVFSVNSTTLAFQSAIPDGPSFGSSTAVPTVVPPSRKHLSDLGGVLLVGVANRSDVKSSEIALGPLLRLNGATPLSVLRIIFICYTSWSMWNVSTVASTLTFNKVS